MHINLHDVGEVALWAIVSAVLIGGRVLARNAGKIVVSSLDLPESDYRISPRDAILEALISSDPCAVGVFEADELYPRVVERMLPELPTIRTVRDMRSAMVQAILAVDGPPPSSDGLQQAAEQLRGIYRRERARLHPPSEDSEY